MSQRLSVIDICIEIRFEPRRIDVDGMSEGRDGGREAVAGSRSEFEHCRSHVLSELRAQPRRCRGRHGPVELTKREHEMTREVRS